MMARRGNVKLSEPSAAPTLADVLAVLDEIGNAMAGIEVSEAKKNARQLARRLRAFGWSGLVAQTVPASVPHPKLGSPYRSPDPADEIRNAAERLND